MSEPCASPAELARAANQILLAAGRGPDDPRKLQLEPAAQCRIDALLRCAAVRQPSEYEPAMLAGLGRLAHLGLHDLERAGRFYAAAIAAAPESLPWRAEGAQLLVDRERFAEAIPQLLELERRAVAQGDRHRTIYALEYLGRAHTGLGQLADADAALRRSVTLLDALTAGERNYWGCPYHALGELNSRRIDPAGKAAALVHAAEIEVRDAGTQVEAAIALHAAGEFERSRTYAERAPKIDPDHMIAEAARAVVEASLARERERAAGPVPTAVLLRDAGRLVRMIQPHEVGASERYVAMAQELEERAATGDPATPTIEAPTPERSARALAAFESGRLEPADAVACAVPSAAAVVPEAVAVACLTQVFLGRPAGGEPVLAWLRAQAGPVAPALLEGFQLLSRKEAAVAESRFTTARLALEGAKPTADVLGPGLARLVLLGAAWALQGQERHADALPVFDRLLALLPGHVPALLGKGHSLLALARGAEAKAVFERVLAAHPNHPDALSAVGLVHYNDGRLGEAEQAFRDATEAGRYTCPHEGLGLVYLRQGRTAAAKREFETAIEIDPDVDFKKYNELAKLLISEGALDRARTLLRKSLANRPGNEEAQRLLASIEGK